MTELFADHLYEEQMVKEYGIETGDSGRELYLAGAYSPVKGILSLGWDKWKDEPAGDFVQGLVDWWRGAVRDVSSKPWVFGSHLLIGKGELGMDDLKTWAKGVYVGTTDRFMFEGLAEARAHAIRARDIRDLILRHLFEEMGHHEMMGDFLVGVFGMSREKEVYPLENPNNFPKGLLENYNRRIEMCAKGSFVEIAAVNMLEETWIPRPTRIARLGLSKHYQIPDKHLMFFDIHSYIDIYHERYGKYIIAKYATTKELQEKTEKSFKETMTRVIQQWERNYDAMAIHKR